MDRCKIAQCLLDGMGYEYRNESVCKESLKLGIELVVQASNVEWRGLMTDKRDGVSGLPGGERGLPGALLEGSKGGGEA